MLKKPDPKTRATLTIHVSQARANPVQPAPFDALADDYDGCFSHHPLGQALRSAVWRHIDPHFGPGMRVLDLGCGTGEDALHLAARGVRVMGVDASAAMLRVARSKAATRGLADRVRLVHADLGRTDAGELAGTGTFDGALSNFGALNCLPTSALMGLGISLATLVRPGGQLVAVVMGPSCAWELLWYAARGDFARAARRRKREGVVADLGSGPMTAYYPSAGSLTATFAPHFRLVEVVAIGSVLPPTYAAGWIERRPRALAWLARADRRIERWPAAVALADHYLARFERIDSA